MLGEIEHEINLARSITGWAPSAAASQSQCISDSVAQREYHAEPRCQLHPRVGLLAKLGVLLLAGGGLLILSGRARGLT